MPWPLLNLKPLHRNVIFATENHFSLAKWISLLSVAFSASGIVGDFNLKVSTIDMHTQYLWNFVNIYVYVSVEVE